MAVRGAKTSKRFYLATRVLPAICIVGLTAMVILAYHQEWNYFASVTSATIITMGGLAGSYKLSEAYYPHPTGADNTVIIQQGSNTGTFEDSQQLPKNPYIES